MNNNKDVKGTFWQVIATVVIWTMMTGGIALGSIFLAPSLGEEVLGFFFMLFAAAALSTGFVWDWGQVPGKEGQRSHQGKQKNEGYDYDESLDEKRKRDRLSAALKSLSDEELIRLRSQITRGDVQEEELASLLDDNR